MHLMSFLVAAGLQILTHPCYVLFTSNTWYQAETNRSRVWTNLMDKVLHSAWCPSMGASTNSDGTERFQRFLMLTLPFMTVPAASWGHHHTPQIVPFTSAGRLVYWIAISSSPFTDSEAARFSVGHMRLS
ncbi:hypothetical protein EV401DRAFT_62633 [Pisolithus croceorrhizus]|nr:hypothetical protein EV401DRAFT_62633 [Pisolithus croceorrhizus]